MKKVFTIVCSLLILGVIATSCTGEDNTVDTVFADVTNGAVLRGVTLISNEIPVGVVDANFSIELEEQDNQDGALLESMDVYVTFADNTPDEGDSTGATFDEVFLRNVPASEWAPGPFGLPRFTLTITVQEYLAAVGLSDLESIFGGDTFSTRLSLNLTDGRVFSVSNAGAIITGGFFNSPFQYLTPVVCPVEEEFFTGNYNVTQVTQSIFGYDTFDPDGGGIVLELFNAAQAVDDNGDGILTQPDEAEALTSTQRAFDADYIASLAFGNTRTYIIDYVCNEVTFPTGQTTGLQCAGGGITLGPPSGPNGMYDFEDDSVFNLIFTDDEIDDCSQGSPDVELLWEKQ